MRIDSISVELRPRSSWEAAELGTALVRTHARAIWVPWLWVTLPVFVLLNAIGWWLDLVVWAGVAFWFLKPVFDRIPLFVVSRAVFGAVPTVRETLAAQRTWGWRWMLHHLTWRRLGPYRSLYLPVDLLEGGTDKHARRNVIGGSARGVAAWLTIVFINFELALLFGAMALIPLFTPLEAMDDAWSWVRDMILAAESEWGQVAQNAMYYVAMSLMEPFYVGAGFGLYLNRRTQLEAWDVELAFRRLRARIGATLMVAVIALGVAMSPVRDAHATPTLTLPASAATTQPASASTSEPALTFRESMGTDYIEDKDFERSVAKTDDDPRLHPKTTRTVWVPIDKSRPDPRKTNSMAVKIAEMIGKALEASLWVALGLIVLALAITWKRWLPWLRGAMPQAQPAESAIDVAPIDHDAALPDDVAGSVRRLWAEGRTRRALALLYRASVEAMTARTGALLVPGATEAECLRASRALASAEERDTFARIVRTWQYAAYAHRLPEAEDFDALLVQASQRFGWAT